MRRFYVFFWMEHGEFWQAMLWHSIWRNYDGTNEISEPRAVAPIGSIVDEVACFLGIWKKSWNGKRG